MTTQLEDIGAMVKHARQRRGLEVAAISELAGVHHQTWYRVERGESVYSNKLQIIVAMVGLTLTVKSCH